MMSKKRICRYGTVRIGVRDYIDCKNKILLEDIEILYIAIVRNLLFYLLVPVIGILF